MKKALSLILSLMMVMVLLAGCGDDVDKKGDPTPTTAPTDTPAPTNTPAPTDTPTPTPTPEVDMNVFLKMDFDNDSTGTLILLGDYPDKLAPKYAPMFFGSMGDAYGELAADEGVDGSACLYVNSRTSSWNGISLNISEDMKGKGYKISFDAKFASEELDEATISLTTKFNISKVDDEGKETISAQYPDYNRVRGAVSKTEWTHFEGTVYFPTDAFVDPEDGGTNMIMYFELPESNDDFYLDNIDITVVDGIGDFAAMEENGKASAEE